MSMRRVSGGSPTAVLETESLTEVECLQVPKLMGVSHAAFVGDRDGPAISLRFFTATGQLPACRHGTVAALAFLAEHAARDCLQVTLRASKRSFAGEGHQRRRPRQRGVRSRSGGPTRGHR
jgi:trans-2,3-dihydro-3-hydroxyanthranilate isomerase